MDTEDAFLADIVTNPEDDTPRMVYADWLEERGDWKAPFVRCRYPISMDNYWYSGVYSRDKKGIAWRKYVRHMTDGVFHHAWPLSIVEYPGPDSIDESFPAKFGGRCAVGAVHVALRHGFVCGVALTLKHFIKAAPDLFSSQPVESVVLTDRTPVKTHRGYQWFRGYSMLPSFIIDLLWNRDVSKLRYGYHYRSLGSAYEDLSQACVRFGRDAARRR